MTERKPFTVGIDGQDHELLPDNHGVAMFRDTPEYDYFFVQEEVGPPDALETKTHLVFRHQWLCHWMGNLALNGKDQLELNEVKEELGNFKERYGWASKVMIEDEANEFERECYTESLLGDLKGADTVPEEWTNEE